MGIEGVIGASLGCFEIVVEESGSSKVKVSEESVECMRRKY
jgi:hypothetical protein